MNKNALIIMGATATGKSAVALEIAERTGGEIISADSMQIYMGLDIGTAKPTDEQLARVPHHMIDVADPKEPYSVAAYRRQAGAAIEDVLSRGKLPIIVGGTGLYIHSLIYDMDFGGGKVGESVRREYERLAKECGGEHLHTLLAERDAEVAAQIHPNNVKRIIRALERTHGSYAPFSFYLNKSTLIDPTMILLTMEREKLVSRIEDRVDEMLSRGLVDEVRGLAAIGLTTEQIAMLGIGYKEALGYIDGEYNYDEMAELIKVHTRRYAKRQVTWFKRYKDAQVINVTNLTSAATCDIIIRDIINI